MATIALVLLVFQTSTGHGAWDRWKEGSWVRMKQTGILDQEYLTTLTKRTDQETSLEVVNFMNGVRMLAVPVTWKTSESCAHCKNPAQGTERLKVGGKDYECTRHETRSSEGSETIWFSKDLQMTIKFVSKQGDSVTEMTAVKMSEELTVAGKKIPCVVLEGKGNLAGLGVKYSLKRWYSSDMPGFLVREVTKTLSGNENVDGEKIVTAFEAKK